jgi:RNA polymerase subunit RPABC4/transcription elongation factor Spt4
MLLGGFIRRIFLALVACKECGKRVSSKANTCPNCGNPLWIKKTTNWLGCQAAGFIFIVAMLGVFLFLMDKCSG